MPFTRGMLHMPRNNLFQTSLLLAVSGLGSAVFGICVEQFKPILIGFVLLSGAGIFATLYLGTRRSAANPKRENSTSPDGGGTIDATR